MQTKCQPRAQKGLYMIVNRDVTRRIKVLLKRHFSVKPISTKDIQLRQNTKLSGILSELKLRSRDQGSMINDKET